MNTRILRMLDRSPLGDLVHVVPGLGQASPAAFYWSGGEIVFRCEALVNDGDPIHHEFMLRTHRDGARAAFASLERHRALGTKTPAAMALAVLEARRLAEVRSKPRPRPHRRAANGR